MRIHPFRLAITLIALLYSLPAADPVKEARKPDPERQLAAMRALREQRKWKELIEAHGEEDFAAWPAEAAPQAAEALHLRGQVFSFTKNGSRAEADLQAALKLSPKDPAIWLTLAENCVNNLNDDDQALAAYRQVLTLTGTGPGWQPLTATIGIARLLTDQVKPDDALAALRPYGFGEALPANWRIRILRAYAHAHAAKGNETESLAKFREALRLESGAQP